MYRFNDTLVRFFHRAAPAEALLQPVWVQVPRTGSIMLIRPGRCIVVFLFRPFQMTVTMTCSTRKIQLRLCMTSVCFLSDLPPSQTLSQYKKSTTRQDKKRRPSKMNLFSVLLAWLLAMTASAVSTPDHFAPPFRVFAWNPNSPIHNLPMTASSLSFFLGGNTTTFCPPSLNGNCPPGNETVLAFNGTAMVLQP